MNLDFQVLAFFFFQTNIDAVEHLYEAIGLLDSVEGKTVYDLYCGTGTICSGPCQASKVCSWNRVGAQTVFLLLRLQRQTPDSMPS